ncbi:retinol dehydrogenase 7 [Patella vulgata]|uniref:retinol dehydrogenase 7 n=1 Tax=Patella vulgata TaxID=6465 RepID=UPI00217F9146|nr:retinol dehydrogenase 7 [Patella vulgata]
MPSFLENLSVQTLERIFGVVVLLSVYVIYQQYVIVTILSVIILYITLYYYKKKQEKYIPLTGQSVLITGCDTGIGHKLAVRLGKSDVTVFACCLSSSSKGALKLKSVGSNVHVLSMNVKSDESIEECLQYVKERCQDKGLWGIVNNAGIVRCGDVELTTMSVYKDVVDVNLFGMIRVCKAFIPLVRKAKGRVINVTSVRGIISYPAFSAYSMSKFAAEAFSDSLRMEMSRFGVKVVIVEPGNYGGATGLWDEENKERILNSVDEMNSEASLEVLDTYGNGYLRKLAQNGIDGCSTTYPNLNPVTDVLYNAIFNLNPQTRYLIDGSNKIYDIDCVMGRLRSFVPTWMMDYVVMTYYGPPKPPVVEP